MTCAIAGATSAGGAPVGSDLYCAKAASEQTNNAASARIPNHVLIISMLPRRTGLLACRFQTSNDRPGGLAYLDTIRSISASVQEQILTLRCSLKCPLLSTLAPARP